MSGPSAQQLTLQDEQLQFYMQGMTEARSAFAEQQDLLSQMEAAYSPILKRGANSDAFAGAEENALNAGAVQGTATNYAGAARAVNEGIAAQGGGEPLAPGAGAQLKEEVAMSAAGQESEEEQQIKQAGYAAGEREFEQAGEALATASGQLSPTSYETAATGSGEAAEQTANQINQEENSWVAPVLGAASSVADTAIPTPGL